MRKNIQHIKLNKATEATAVAEAPITFTTAEGIGIKPTYTEADNEGMEHLDFGAGFAPNPVSYTHLTLPTKA